jgi:uncharacterized repeat protein (TIGR02543 family)
MYLVPPATTLGILPQVEPTRAGYIFTGWTATSGEDNGNGKDFLADTTVSAHINIYAKWLELPAGSFIVHFDKNNTDKESQEAHTQNKAVFPGKTTIDELPINPMRIGYDFNAWDTKADGSGAIFNETTSVSANITVYAKWDPYRCIVTFYKTHDDEEKYDEKTIVYPETTLSELPPPPVREHHIFKGWQDEDKNEFTEDTTLFVKNESGGITRNEAIALYAQWEEKPYTISGKVTVEGTDKPLEGARVEFIRDSNEPPGEANTGSDGIYTLKVPAGTFSITVSLIGYTSITDSYTVSGDATRNYSLAPMSYTIVYDKNASDATGTTKPSTHIYDNEGPLTPNGFTRPGYTFAGWSKNETGAVEFSNNQEVKHEPKVDGETITLYACWTFSQYFVYFDANSAGGSPPAMQKVNLGASVNALPERGNLVRGSYTFGGWNTQSDGEGKNYEAGSSYAPSGNDRDITLYAKWHSIVTFNTNDATGTAHPPQTVNAGNSITIPDGSGFSKTGFAFDGWSTNRTGTGTNYAASSTYTPTASITLYAKWNPIPQYTITFNKNGATNGTEPAKQTVFAGTSITLPGAGNLSKTGHTFGGWNTSANGSGTNYAVGSSYAVSANITLYAKWDATYAINYNANGATSGTAPSTQSVNSGSSVTIPGVGNLLKTGHNFGGWNTNASGTGTNYSAGATYTPTSSITLYAKWEPILKTVTFNSNGGSSVSPQTVIMGTTATRPTNPTKADNTFDNWYSNSGLTTVYNFSAPVNDNITLYAKWNAVPKYTITFNSNGGSSVAAQTVNSGTTATRPTNPTRTGYTFDNWYSNSGLTTVYNFSAPVTGNITLYAKWTAITYTITYLDLGGGTFSGTHGNNYPRTHTYGTATTLVSPTKTGYTFGGWFANSSGTGTALTSLSATGYTANITLYAKWTVNTYTITYRDTGGGTFSGIHGPNYPTTHTFGTTTTLVSPTKANYKFEGWYTNSNGTGAALASLSATGYTGPIILHAKWAATAAFGKITLEGGGSVANVLVQLYKVEANVPIPVGPSVTPGVNDMYTAPGITSDSSYFISASCEGYMTMVVPVDPYTVFPLNIELKKANARSISQGIEQMIMEVIKRGE